MTPRADALRSRERILEAARATPVRDLRLNDLATAAGVGVGTVYRHFATVPALVEALNADGLRALVERGRHAAGLADADAAFSGFLRDAVALLVAHEGLQGLVLSTSATPEVAADVAELHDLFRALLEAARGAGAVRTDLTAEHVQRLLCGVDHAVRLGDPGDRALLLDVMLAGLRPVER